MEFLILVHFSTEFQIQVLNILLFSQAQGLLVDTIMHFLSQICIICLMIGVVNSFSTTEFFGVCAKLWCLTAELGCVSSPWSKLLRCPPYIAQKSPTCITSHGLLHSIRSKEIHLLTQESVTEYCYSHFSKYKKSFEHGLRQYLITGLLLGKAFLVGLLAHHLSASHPPDYQLCEGRNYAYFTQYILVLLVPRTMTALGSD